MQVLKRSQSFPLSLPDFLKLMKQRPLLSEQESWDLYKSFVRLSFNRIPLESWHFGSFMNMLFQPFIPSYSRYGLDVVKVPERCLERFGYMKQDMDSLNLKGDKSVFSSILQSQIFLNETPSLMEQYDIDSYNMVLKQIKSPTKRSVWELYTQIKKANEIPNLYTYEWFMYLFGHRLRDPKATSLIFSKLSHQNLDFRHESFVIYIDAMGEVGGQTDHLNKLMYRYKSNPSMPTFGTREDLVQAMLKFWVHLQNPNPCFKLLHTAKKRNLTLSLESIGLLLDACYLYNGKEPIAGREIVEPLLLKMMEDGHSWKYLELLLEYYSRYETKEYAFRVWQMLIGITGFEYELLETKTVNAILYIFGNRNEPDKATELIKAISIQLKNPEVLHPFMNGYLDKVDDVDGLTEIVKEIRVQANL
jgi:hypothetical protein